MSLQRTSFRQQLRSRAFVRRILVSSRFLVHGAIGKPPRLRCAGADSAPTQRLNPNGRPFRGFAQDSCDPLHKPPPPLRLNMMSPASNTLASRTFVELLRERAKRHGDSSACTFLTDGESAELTFSYAELDRRARRIAVGCKPTAPPADPCCWCILPDLTSSPRSSVASMRVRSPFRPIRPAAIVAPVAFAVWSPMLTCGWHSPRVKCSSRWAT